jgi:hypothetical protein
MIFTSAAYIAPSQQAHITSFPYQGKQLHEVMTTHRYHLATATEWRKHLEEARGEEVDESSLLPSSVEYSVFVPTSCYLNH